MITHPNLQPLARIKQIQVAALTCLACLLLTLAPLRGWTIEASKTPLEHRLQQHPSVDDIARQINQQHKWRILSAEPTVEDEKTLYRFKLLNKKRGRVRVIIIDPSNPDLKYLE